MRFRICGVYMGLASVIISTPHRADAWLIPLQQPTKHMPWARLASTTNDNSESNDISPVDDITTSKRQKSSYDLGAGKNLPLSPQYDADMTFANHNSTGTSPSSPEKYTTGADTDPSNWWMVAVPAREFTPPKKDETMSQNNEGEQPPNNEIPTRTRRMVARDNDAQVLRAALWDEQHFDESTKDGSPSSQQTTSSSSSAWLSSTNFDDSLVKPPSMVYPNIDMSIPETVYHEGGACDDDGKDLPAVDVVWENLRWEAYKEAQREPLLVSFLYSTILNHRSLESSLAFLLANRLQSPAMMISTQLQSIILDTLERDAKARRFLRADMMAVRDRDPACNTLPDVFLYFKGFHALQSHRVAHNLWRRGKHILASYLQSQVSQVFQIDIHPNATMESGIMLDHGTGIVIGSTASVGHNCSILHHVTLGGSGKKGVLRHPRVQDGVLLGAGATVLGPVTLGTGSQVGAGTLVISDLPPHCVAVGVPARIIGSFIDVTEQPSVGMNQMIEDNSHVVTFESEGI